MTKFVKFTEYNDWEGETWTFWLQVDGNLLTLALLKRKLIDNESYSLDLGTVLDEHDVDVLEEHGGQGYMDYHNKVIGRFVMPPDLDLDDLNKGGVADLFR